MNMKELNEALKIDPTGSGRVMLYFERELRDQAYKP
jgi:hypothetical protein